MPLPFFIRLRPNTKARAKGFGVSEVFANAKVKLLRSEVFAIAKVKFVLRTSEVKFAHHFAVRRNFTHEVNFTYEVNFTCPNGQT